MSLNTVEYNSKVPPKLSDNRSLRTDDIEGAKPRNGLRRNQEQGVYSTISLPSYQATQFSRVPLRAQALINEDISKKADNFYEPSSLRPPETQNYQSNPQLNPKEVAKFYGVTPPRSQAADLYGANYTQGKNVPPKDLVGFHAVTPPFSRPGPVQNSGNYTIPPGQDLGNFARPGKDFSVRDQRSYPQDVYANQSIPPKALAGFYGATPSVSRPGASNNYYGNMPGLESGNPGQGYEANLPSKAYADFYGATPQPSGRPGAYSDNYGQAGTGNMYGGANNATSYMQNQGLSNKDIANFYGVTPVPTGNPHGNPYGQVEVPPKQLANFYGVTPQQTGKLQGNISQEIPVKQYANFYGVTQPATKSKNQDFSGNAAKFFGHDGVDPEFQHAVDVSNKPNYPAGKHNTDPHLPRGHNQASTAARIFNRDC